MEGMDTSNGSEGATPPPWTGVSMVGETEGSGSLTAMDSEEDDFLHNFSSLICQLKPLGLLNYFMDHAMVDVVRMKVWIPSTPVLLLQCSTHAMCR